MGLTIVMKRECIVCGELLKKVICTGTLRGKEIDFCDKHAGYCDNCETIKCRIVESN